MRTLYTSWVGAILILFSVVGIARGANVTVVAFEGVGTEPGQAWIGQAIQQSLVAELSRVQDLDPAGVLKREDAQGEYLVVGSYQIVGVETRITGQVIATETGKVVGGLKATGMMRDLFNTQDTIAEQAKKVLATAMNPPVTQATNQQPAPSPAPGPTIIINNGSQQTPWSDGMYEGSSLQVAVNSRYSPSQIYREPDYARQYDRYRYSTVAYYGYNWGYPSWGWYNRGHNHWCRPHRPIVRPSGPPRSIPITRPGNSLGVAYR